MKDVFPLGCFGNKYREYKDIIKFIEPHINNKSIIIEPFCGSCCVSFNVFLKYPNLKYYINDLDNYRIEFYNNMKSEDGRNELYKIENDIKILGRDYYNSIVQKSKTDKNHPYLAYVIGKRIHAYREGLYPDKGFNCKIITDNWINFFNSCEISSYNYKIVIDKFKDDENALIYCDPPYLNSSNTQYMKYNENSEIQDDNNIIITDNTFIYIDLLNYLKTSKCKIFISINKNAITEYLFKDFIINEYLKKYDTSIGGKCKNKKRIENILYLSNSLIS
jgi:site-specific DNA-adenine methylase